MYNLNFLDQLFEPVSTYKSIKPHRSVFYEISNSYYHENYHSDILAFYLSDETVKGKFINWLNRGTDFSKKISYQEYKGGEVKREKGKIDITLFNDDHSKAIIIENKSNNALDQFKQLYRYHKTLEDQGIEVEKICYINKNSNKKPDLSDLDKKDQNTINSILKVTQLVGTDSLSRELLEKVIIETQDIQLNALSRELILLFKYVVYGETNMDDIQLLINELKKDGNKSKLDKVIESYKEMPKFLAAKYKDYLTNKNTKYRIWISSEKCLVIDDIRYNENNFAIDLWFSTNSVDISFLVRPQGNETNEDSFRQMLGNKLPFSNERKEGRYRFSLSDPLNEKMIKKQINELLNIIKFLE